MDSNNIFYKTLIVGGLVGTLSGSLGYMYFNNKADELMISGKEVAQEYKDSRKNSAHCLALTGTSIGFALLGITLHYKKED